MTKMKAYELFDCTQWRPSWKQIGDHVSYDYERRDNTLLIFFQPSNEKIDWIRNFSFRKKPYKDMEIEYKVHGGFLKAWKEVEDKIGEIIADKTIKKIVISGYSHGGALAAFCHEYCWFHRPDIRDNIVGYGFEAPRIFGSRKVPDNLKERWQNFTVIRTSNDIVTQLPPLCFCHVGQVLHLDKNQKYGPFTSHRPQMVFWAVRYQMKDIDII